MFYAVRVSIPDPFFYLKTGDKEYVFLDHREYGVFEEKNKNPHIQLVLLNPLIDAAKKMELDTTGENKLALHILREYGADKEEIEVPNNLPLSMADFLRSQGIALKVCDPFFPERLQKTSEEVAALRESLKRTQAAFDYIEDRLRGAVIDGDVLKVDGGEILTSEKLSVEVEHVLLDQDLINEEGMIISCGPHAAIPHHRGAGPLRPHQTIICDIFPRHRASGYFADTTRTYIKGNLSPEIDKMYKAVQRAQADAIAAVKPGMRALDVHQVCIDIFLELGYDVGDKGFVHGTGHGLGLDIHELPYINPRWDHTLEVGNVVTVEPGLYYPELGGVRIEDVVVVTEDGCKNLTEYRQNYHIE